MQNPLRRLTSLPLWSTAQGRLLVLLLALLALGMLGEAWRFARDTLHSVQRGKVMVKLGMRHGVAISLNRYAKMLGRDVQLPGDAIKGALCDRAGDDWILFGESDPHRTGLPLDAVALAARTLRAGLDSPGIDIRPVSGQPQNQQVTYFGGVSHTIVGEWFFDFDYWMKQASLDRDPRPVPGLPVYWQRAVAELDQSVQKCTSTGQSATAHGNRFWLCAGEFEAVESSDALVYQRTPMLVLAEKLEKSVWAGSGESPCASKGTDDPLAAEFSTWLTRHLDELQSRLPVNEITSFAQLVSLFSWLAEQDPQHDIEAWVRASPTDRPTPANVATLAMETTRTHLIPVAGGAVQHEHKLLLSGGVMIAPRLSRVKAAGDVVETLESAIVHSRPAAGAPYWFFPWNRE